jgi:hypothetical protein
MEAESSPQGHGASNDAKPIIDSYGVGQATGNLEAKHKPNVSMLACDVVVEMVR